MPIPNFCRTYRLKVTHKAEMPQTANAPKVPRMLLINGVDFRGASFTIFKKLTVTGLSEEPLELPKTKT